MPAVFFDNVPGQRRAPARWRWTTTPAIRLLVEHLVARPRPPADRLHGAARGGRDRAPADLLQGAGRERLEAFRAAVGRAGLPLPPEYVRTSEPASFGRGRPRGGARADGARAAADRDRRRHRRARHRAPARAARRRAARAGATSRWCRFDEPVAADLLDPPLTVARPPRPRARPDRRRGAAAHAARRRHRGRDRARARRAERPAVVRMRLDRRQRSMMQTFATAAIDCKTGGGDGAGDRYRRDRHGLDGARAHARPTGGCPSTSPTSGCAPDCSTAADIERRPPPPRRARRVRDAPPTTGAP